MSPSSASSSRIFNLLPAIGASLSTAAQKERLDHRCARGGRHSSCGRRRLSSRALRRLEALQATAKEGNGADTAAVSQLVSGSGAGGLALGALTRTGLLNSMANTGDTYYSSAAALSLPRVLTRRSTHALTHFVRTFTFIFPLIISFVYTTSTPPPPSSTTLLLRTS
ncbi:hypothetical protein MSAN_02280600 [Mycena sanguinolenta]|uniref:Uncharacterized protein n=1 Tax=Mycena sanguinolenta TaxID=230812 RepID=A0A8H6XAX1_9AGAR|nr:hypothetical protein MSAN_02280600 [Mycena sanguinolenta]